MKLDKRYFSDTVDKLLDEALLPTNSIQKINRRMSDVYRIDKGINVTQKCNDKFICIEGCYYGNDGAGVRVYAHYEEDDGAPYSKLVGIYHFNNKQKTKWRKAKDLIERKFAEMR